MTTSNLAEERALDRGSPVAGAGVKYLFVHIPKTAGVKIRHNIHMNAGWPDATLCVQEEGEDLRYYTDAQLRAFSLVSGHFGYALRQRLEPERRCVTVLRRPLQRVVSLYQYWKTLAGTSQARLATGQSIYEFVASRDPLVIEHIDNAQTWQIFWDHSVDARRRFASRSPADVLGQAIRNLASLDFVGLQEELAGTLSKMQRKFAWRWTDESVVRINRTPPYDREPIDLKCVRRELGDRIALDEALYATAERSFREA